jgi:hypothetical protein
MGRMGFLQAKYENYQAYYFVIVTMSFEPE